MHLHLFAKRFCIVSLEMVSHPVHVTPFLSDDHSLDILISCDHSKLYEMNPIWFYSKWITFYESFIGNLIIKSMKNGFLEHLLSYLYFWTISFGLFRALPLSFLGHPHQILLNLGHSIACQCWSIKYFIKLTISLNLSDQTVKLSFILD